MWGKNVAVPVGAPGLRDDPIARERGCLYEALRRYRSS